MRWLAVAGEGDEFSEHSWFDGELSSTDFGDALTLLGYPQAVAGGKGTASWQLDWPGSPQQFSAAQLSGKLAVDAEGGSLLGIEPGLGRLFGVLSLSTLQRRMSFDFRDVVGVGFVFDDLKASMSANNGQVDIAPIKLKGPAATITVTGQFDLATQELDLQAGVVPKVTESLPLAASIGSLGLGAAVYIGQKILASQIDSATLRNYRVTGSIDEPNVEQVGKSGIEKLLGVGRESVAP